MDKEQIAQLVDDKSYKAAVEQLELHLRHSNFKIVLKDLAAVLFSPQVDNATSLQFVIHCLLYCQWHLDTTSPGLKHLLLELITPDAAVDAGEAVRIAAVQLFHAYCTVQDAKLAAKVAIIFRLTRADLTDWHQVELSVQQLLQSQSSYKAAVHMMMQFEGLDEVIDKSEVITQLVADGQENLCQQWVTSLGRDYQIEFLEACVALDKLKPAAKAVRQLGLQAEFPIEALYRQRSLARLIDKRLWSVALSFAGNDTVLQTTLVRDMAQVGELSLAEDYRKQLGLPASVLTIDPEQLAAQEAARREQYIQIKQYINPEEQLLFVCDEAGLLRASAVLSGSDVLGLDVEWKPTHVAGVSSPAAVLQVATRTTAVLLDLITLAQQHPAALNVCLQPLFSSSDTLKLGFAVSGDLAKLANSWPQIQAFRHVAGVLDLKPLWIAYGSSTRRQGASVKLLSAVGLSSLCKALLGKPLDKSQQMSDWTARPLTPRQLHYAALDALVLPQLYDVLCRELGPERQQQLLKQHMQSFVRQTSPPQVTMASGALTACSSTTQSKHQHNANNQQSKKGLTAAGAELVVLSQGSRHAGTASALEKTAPVRSSSPAGYPAVGATDNSAQGGCFHDPGLPGVVTALQQHGIEDRLFWLHPGPGESITRQVSAGGIISSVLVPRSHVAKTMAVLVDHEPLLVVTRGDQRIDMHKLAAVLGVKRKVIRLAPNSMAQELTGFAPGGIPPLGHGQRFNIIVDSRLDPATAAASPCDTNQVAHSVYHLRLPESSIMVWEAPLHSNRHLGFDSWQDSVGAGKFPVGVAATPQTTSVVRQSLVASTCAGAHQDSRQQMNNSHSSIDRITTDAAASLGRCSDNSTHAFEDDQLYVQCGSDALVVLSFQQLLQLTDGQVADVADVPAEASASAASSAAAVAELGQQLDPHVSGGQQSVPSFLVDSMLGRLCRWLRALGVDAQFVEPGGTLQQRQELTAADRQQQLNSLIQQIQDAAEQEGRLFLTRDSKLAARRDVGGSVYLLDTDDTAQQLSEISNHFGIRFDEQTAMSRCSNCNAAAFQLISKEEATSQVPQRVMGLVDEFWRCGRCGKVFWMGPKSYAALELLGGLFTNGKVRPTPLQSSRHLTSRTKEARNAAGADEPELAQQPVSSEADQEAEAADTHTAAGAGEVVQPAEVQAVGVHETMDVDAGGQQAEHPAAADDGVQHGTHADDSMQAATDFDPPHSVDGMQAAVEHASSETETPQATVADSSMKPAVDHHEAPAEGGANQHVNDHQISQQSGEYAAAGEAAAPQEYTEHEQSSEHYAAAEAGEHQPVTYPAHHYGVPSHAHTTGTSTGSPKKGLTFSGAPYVPKAKPYARADYSHSNNRLMKIAHDNQKLVERLTEVSRKAPNWSEDLTKTAPGNIASSAVNRRKAATDIAQENHALYQRLVAIRPSKDISRDTLEGEHRKNESYRLNCATFKPGSPTHSMTHSMTHSGHDRQG